MADEYYNYIKDTGVIVPDTATVKSEIEDDWRTIFGADFDVSEETPQGRIIEMITQGRVFTLGITALMANQINIDYATGSLLDAIGSFYGIPRFGATYTNVLATLTGQPNTTIPAGSLAETDDGDRFALTTDVLLPSSGSNTAYFSSVVSGAIPCPVGSLNKIVNSVLGWETVINDVAGNVGVEQESDFDFRRRIKASRYTGISLVQSIGSAINQVTGVLSSFVMDNGNADPIVYEGITLDAHSILCIIDGGSDHDVADAIFRKKSSGSAYTAIPDQSVVVPIVDGFYQVEYDVTFNRPKSVSIVINISVKRGEYTGEDLQSDVKNAIVNWSIGGVESVDGMKIGNDISPFEIAAAVSEQIPSIFVSNCQIGIKPETGDPTLSTDVIPITIAEKGTIDINDITVVIQSA